VVVPPDDKFLWNSSLGPEELVVAAVSTVVIVRPLVGAEVAVVLLGMALTSVVVCGCCTGVTWSSSSSSTRAENELTLPPAVDDDDDGDITPKDAALLRSLGCVDVVVFAGAVPFSF